jgi:uncharacterized membrane protein
MGNKIMRGLLAVLSIIGVTVSVLALRVHYMDPGAEPPCAVTEKFDCGIVNHSRFAVFPARMVGEDQASGKVHIPVAIFGIVGYSLMFFAALFGRWWVLLQLAEIGFAAACFLSYLEAFVLEKWCIYCLYSQATVTAILLGTIVALFLSRRQSLVPGP